MQLPEGARPQLCDQVTAQHQGLEADQPSQPRGRHLISGVNILLNAQGGGWNEWGEIQQISILWKQSGPKIHFFMYFGQKLPIFPSAKKEFSKSNQKRISWKNIPPCLMKLIVAEVKRGQGLEAVQRPGGQGGQAARGEVEGLELRHRGE